MEGRLAEEAKGPVGGLAEKGSRKVDEQAEPRATVAAVRPTLLLPVPVAPNSLLSAAMAPAVSG